MCGIECVYLWFSVISVVVSWASRPKATTFFAYQISDTHPLRVPRRRDGHSRDNNFWNVAARSSPPPWLFDTIKHSRSSMSDWFWDHNRQTESHKCSNSILRLGHSRGHAKIDRGPTSTVLRQLARMNYLCAGRWWVGGSELQHMAIN